MGLSSLGILSSLSLMTLISWEIELDSNGQQPNSISNNTTPSDQISALSVQISSLRISGAMYIGEPSIVCAIFISSILQNPKSPNLTFPSEKKILSGFRSRCIMLFLFNSLKASNNCRKITSASSSFSIFFFWRRDSKVPPLQYSQTKQKLLGVLRVSINLTMLSFLSVDKILISLIASCQSLGLALNDDFGMTLTAYQSLDFWWIARKTWPQTPLPMGYWRRQFQTNLLIQIFNSEVISFRKSKLRHMVGRVNNVTAVLMKNKEQQLLYVDAATKFLNLRQAIIILQIMLLREILQHFQSQEQPGVFQDITFRQKDTSLLRQQCQRKYNQYLDMHAQKLELQQKLQKLKEELCRINPEALEEIEREGSQRNESEEEGAAKGKKSKVVAKVGNGKIGKKNQRRKKTPKLTYS